MLRRIVSPYYITFIILSVLGIVAQEIQAEESTSRPAEVKSGQGPVVNQSSDLPWYQNSYRRLLLDMHIPDWDEAFLSKYDPAEMADNYQRANLSSVMIYSQSLMGLTNWETKSGQMHRGLKGRDVLGEMVEELKNRDIPVTAYYAVTFNDWAYMEHPEWRMNSHIPIKNVVSRSGFCCLNNPGYKAFVMQQMEELVPRYDFDGVFFDFTLWSGVCKCPHCTERYQREVGSPMPEVVDWINPAWCTFQATRERWLNEFAKYLTTTVKKMKPNVTVVHNYPQALNSWYYGTPLDSSVSSDFLGGDFFGDATEQLTMGKILLNLTPNKPAEFMTSVCVNIGDHVGLKPTEQLQTQAFAAVLMSSAFRFIDGIDPVGTVNRGKYERIGEVYRALEPFEPFLGGEPVEDIAVYFSGDSKMDFNQNGSPIENVTPHGDYRYPHMVAVRGACRLLQETHLPFGIITRKQLSQLDRYKLVILPDVLRMDREEVEAFRAYVKRGGRIYASRYTSLTETKGVRHDDFMLADVFGCHYGENMGAVWAYLKPHEEFVRSAIAPQDYVGLNYPSMLLLKEEAEGVALANLTLHYGYPHGGTMEDHHFASMHSFPPWDDTSTPTLVLNQYGKGESIYSAATLETSDVAANKSLFLALIDRLSGNDLSWRVKTHPAVWMTAFDQPEKNRMTLSFLNYPAQFPAVPITRIPVTIKVPEGKKLNRVFEAPDGPDLEFSVGKDQSVQFEASQLEVFKMLVLEYSDR